MGESLGDLCKGIRSYQDESEGVDTSDHTSGRARGLRLPTAAIKGSIQCQRAKGLLTEFLTDLLGDIEGESVPSLKWWLWPRLGLPS